MQHAVMLGTPVDVIKVSPASKPKLCYNRLACWHIAAAQIWPCALVSLVLRKILLEWRTACRSDG